MPSDIILSKDRLNLTVLSIILAVSLSTVPAGAQPNDVQGAKDNPTSSATTDRSFSATTFESSTITNWSSAR